MITEAIKRLKYTIGNKNKPNVTDAEALNEVLKHISEIQQANVNSNLLFAKLFALYLTKTNRDIKDIDSSIKVAYNALKMPLEGCLQLLADQVRVSELESYVNTLTIDGNLEELKDLDKCIEAENKFFSVHQKAIFKKISQLWTEENIADHFYLTVNEFLKDEKLKQ